MQAVNDEILFDCETIGNAVKIPVQSEKLDGRLLLPDDATALVVVAHTHDDARGERQRKILARHFGASRIAILEIQLLTDAEKAAAESEPGFCNLGLLALRIVTTIQWTSRQRSLSHLKLGCMGLGGGGTAALMAGSAFSGGIGALVVADAQPDLVGDRLINIHSPTLLIAGATQDLRQRMNEIGYARLLCEKDLELILRAGTTDANAELNRVAALAANWFARHLAPQQLLNSKRELAFARK